MVNKIQEAKVKEKCAKQSVRDRDKERDRLRCGNKKVDVEDNKSKE